MNPVIKELRDDISGKDIYVVGGGKSFDPDKYVPLLPKDRVVCLNSTIYDFDECLAVMWMDNSWRGKNKKILEEKRHKHAVSFNVGQSILDPRVRGYIQIKNVSCGKCRYDVKRERYNVCGNNVGCCAIDFLSQFTPNRIYLLGFDCNVDESGLSHYHRRYGRMTKQTTYDKSFIPCFERLAEHLKGFRSRVINLSPQTKIKSFKLHNPMPVLENAK